MSQEDSWDPEVGDSRQVEITADEGRIRITHPPHTGEVQFDADLKYPIEQIKSVEIEVVERTGLTTVRAVPTGDYHLRSGLSGSNSDSPGEWELVEELRRLAAELGRTPTLTHVADYSEYSREDYLETFDSYIDALDMAQLEPTMTQYNFSDREKPEDKQGTKNTRYLNKHGPATSDELPGSVGRGDKKHGMAKFSINTSTGRALMIYYLMDDHSKQEVVRKFFEEAPGATDMRQQTLVMKANNHGSGWGDAVKKVIGEFTD